MNRCAMNPSTGPDIDLCDEHELCEACDGTGIDNESRHPWMDTECGACDGTGYKAQYRRKSREDHDADRGDAAAREERIHGSDA